MMIRDGTCGFALAMVGNSQVARATQWDSHEIAAAYECECRSGFGWPIIRDGLARMTPRLKWNLDTDPAQRAARVVGLHALAEVNETFEAVRKKSPHSLHDFRVALRRLRSWIHVFRPALDDTLHRRTRRRLKHITRTTAAVRDLDVQIAWLSEEREALGTDRLEAARWIVTSPSATGAGRGAGFAGYHGVSSPALLKTWSANSRGMW